MFLFLLTHGLAFAQVSDSLFTPMKERQSYQAATKYLEQEADVTVATYRWDAESQMSAGLLGGGGLLPAVNALGAAQSLLGRLPESGPVVILAETGAHKASYGFVDGQMNAALIVVPRRAVRPGEDPFSSQRMRPVQEAIRRLGTMCGALVVVERDAYRNPVSWSGQCRDGTMRIELDFRKGDTLRAVWARR